MSKELKNIISHLLAESSHFNVNDVLVNAQQGNGKLHFIEDYHAFFKDGAALSHFPKRILSEARLSKKEAGVNTLCLANGIVHFELNNRSVESPILLTPVTHSVNRVHQQVSFKQVDDASFVNPFILSHFRKQFDLSIPGELLESPELEELISHFESLDLRVNSDTSVIGNFHHHRFQVLKELEELHDSESLNPALNILFGGENTPLPPLDSNPIAVGSTNLFPADTDHEAVFDAVSKSHLVIQGPPGTGKSQVICNLIGKALSSNQTILAVSEKRAALEVIQSKLGQFKLDALSFVAGSDRQSRDFLESLKETWKLFESFQSRNEINLQLSEQYEDKLQMTLDLLNQTDLIGGVSFHEFSELSRGKNIRSNYSSSAPPIAQFIQNKAAIQSIYMSGIDQSVSFIRKKTIDPIAIGSDDFLQLDQRIRSMQEKLISLQEVFTLETWGDLSQAMKEAAVCQVFENELFKQYAAIFTPESKEQKQFARLAKQYAALSNQREIGSEWKSYPSIVEAESLLKQLTQGSFFEKRSAKKRWKQLSQLPVSEAKTTLENRRKAGEDEVKLNKCLTQLKKLGVHHPSKEIEQIQRSMSIFSEDKWKVFHSIPAEHRAKTTLYHEALNDLHRELQSLFKLEDSTSISDVLITLNEKLPAIISERSNLLLLTDQELLSLRGCASLEEYEALVLGSNYVVFNERFPAFSNFQPKEIHEKVADILTSQSSEAKIHADHLLQGIHQKFIGYHTLLNTPASRLKEDQKLLKKELRKGKSLLIKEFGKTRSHPTLRELFASEARHWIFLLKPIWLSNPSSLANCFPMEQNCFDLVIFDEASQIPVQHALGAIQRSKRVVVAGDEHQMGPSNYFQSGSNELTDLLHQASYQFPKVPLLHHYRSAHPSLIAFSNKHFYEGKLTAYPSSDVNEHPIKHHFIENAVFENRVNEIEAKAIAAHISNLLTKKKSLGIVAFSEEQLACIWKQLDASAQEELLLHQESHGGFFKALENVQGDECDSLVIGFGYAPNQDGDFHLRFGPINTENGRKRLNVLLTRARESIDFFCSVKASDFKLSENESINLLRQWIAFSEKSQSNGNVVFPYGLNPRVNGNSLTFDRIQTVLSKAREVATLQNVLEQRGWKVEYR
ncbi:MAG: AAA domain-containing protein [Crocinitomicaceae bacterium]